jgi:2-polyprenyl-6-methoxyphenol hydroxylase-like FAD-dependent oxidoreductase
MKTHCDVLIVGAGPVGLVLALILANHGISFDKREEWSDASKALTITPRTLETLALLGIADRFIKEGISSRYIHFYNYKRQKISSLDFSHIASPYPFLLQLPQNISIQILVDELSEKGIEVERPISLGAVKEENGSCTCTIANTQTGQAAEIHADYVIGCDGAGSIIRELAGKHFAGGSDPEAFVMADVKLRHHPFHNERYMFYLKRKSSLYVMPMKDGYYRIITTTQKRVNEVDDAYVLEYFKSIFHDIGLKEITLSNPLWISTFNPRQHIVDSYITGNILLAGDAAHIQSPVGSQGLNTGIQDAANLGWKLTFVIKGILDPDSLKTYNEERRLVALKLFSYNDKLTKSVFGRNRFSRELAVNKRYLLRIPYFRNKELLTVSQLGIHYSVRPIYTRFAALVKGMSLTEHKYIKEGDRFPSFPVHKDGETINSHQLISIKKYTCFVCITNPGVVSALTSHKNKNELNVINISFNTKIKSDDVYNVSGKYRSWLNRSICLVRPDGYVEFSRQIPT